MDAIDYYNSSPELKQLYDSRVRHYTIKQHTKLVYGQFFKYFDNIELPIKKELFLAFLALHDIGKPIAEKSDNRNNQYIYTQLIIERTNINWSTYSFTVTEKNIVLLLASTDCIGEFFQNKKDIQTVSRELYDLGQKSGLGIGQFFYLFMVYYQCDVAAYTADAGGIKFLEHLFEYKNDSKVFDNNEKLLLFSNIYQTKYKELKNIIYEHNI